MAKRLLWVLVFPLKFPALVVMMILILGSSFFGWIFTGRDDCDGWIDFPVLDRFLDWPMPAKKVQP